MRDGQRGSVRIYFLRHGLAVEPGDWRGVDYDRPLTGEGSKRMGREAKGMAKLKLSLDVILTSPLKRAKQTGRIVAAALKMEDRLFEDDRVGPGFGPTALAAIMRDRQACNDIMLVGHEPTMSATVSHLVGGGRFDFKKGGLACVELAEAGSEDGVLLWLASPKLLLLAKD